MDRCYLKGEQGDRLNAVLCAAGYNIKWLLRMIAKKGVTFLRSLYLRLCEATGVQLNWPMVLRELLKIATAPRIRLAMS
jgi:transposase, IS5 family